MILNHFKVGVFFTFPSVLLKKFLKFLYLQMSISLFSGALSVHSHSNNRCVGDNFIDRRKPTVKLVKVLQEIARFIAEFPKLHYPAPLLTSGIESLSSSMLQIFPS